MAQSFMACVTVGESCSSSSCLRVDLVDLLSGVPSFKGDRMNPCSSCRFLVLTACEQLASDLFLIHSVSFCEELLHDDNHTLG